MPPLKKRGWFGSSAAIEGSSSVFRLAICPYWVTVLSGDLVFGKVACGQLI